MKHRTFVQSYAPHMGEGECGQAFLLHLQKAILLSLEKRGLLTGPEREICVQKLEEAARKKKGNLPHVRL